MIFSIQINNRAYKIDWENPIDISIPLIFNGAQPNAYNVSKATASAFESGELIGDTRQGGSCNFEQVNFIPHCSGTHTECVGHITRERIAVRDCLTDVLIPSVLISIKPENSVETDDTYSVNLSSEDRLITRKSLENALEKIEENWLEGLVIRTLPNDESKMARDYMKSSAPFFTTEAMSFIVEKNINHLLVDMPSIDRTFDEGKLSNHRAFWNVEPGKFETNKKSFLRKTVTEMIFVPDSAADGLCLLNLQIAPFVADASPSRPILLNFREAQ